MSEFHPILAAAVAATGPRVREYRPRFPGPVPQVAPRELARLGLWCARWVERGVPAASRAEFVEALEQAQGIVADEGRARAWPTAPGNVRFKTEHLAIARLAAAASLQAVNNPAATHVALCAAVKLVVRLEHASARRDAAGGRIRAEKFLEALDDELLRLEACAAVRDHAPGADPDWEVEAVLWRKAVGGRVVYWLVRLTAPATRYGLLSKPGARWRWMEGPRDDALSTVPDELFAEAVETSLARDAYLARPRPVTR